MNFEHKSERLKFTGYGAEEVIIYYMVTTSNTDKPPFPNSNNIIRNLGANGSYSRDHWYTTVPNWRDEIVEENNISKNTYLWRCTYTKFSDNHIEVMSECLEMRQAADLVVQSYPLSECPREDYKDLYYERIADWCGKTKRTIIDGSEIVANSITTDHITSDALKTNNYVGPDSGKIFPTQGSYFDFKGGNFYSPSFVVRSNDNQAYFKGNVTADSGTIGGCEIKDGKLEVPSENITGTLTIGQLPNNVATDDDIPTTAEITTITNDTIKTTNVEAQNLKVKAANITDKLTAGQIDTENLTVSNVANVGNFKIEGGNITSDNLSLSTNGKISKSGAGWIDLSHSFGESTSTARYYVRIRTFTSDSLPSDTETEKYVTYTISLEILGPNAPSKNKSITVRWWYGKDQSSSSSETWTFPKGAYSYSRTVTVPVTLLGLSAAIVTTSGNYVSDSHFDQEVTIAETSKNIAINSSLIPINDSGGQGSHNLGSGDRLWSNIFTVTSQIGVSDKKEKNSIKLLTEQYSQMFDLLKPVSYKFNNGSSNRLHLGFIAQDVEDAIFSVGLTNKDFAGLCSWYKQDGTLGYGLRYSEFIALNTHEIQKLKKRVTEQDQKILELEEKLLNLEKLISPSES